MDLKLFTTTFVLIFIAEMGDKTQLAAMGAAAQSQNLWVVWLAACAALICAVSLGVVAGRFFSEWLDPSLIRWVSGSLFIVIGVWILAAPASS